MNIRPETDPGRALPGDAPGDLKSEYARGMTSLEAGDFQAALTSLRPVMEALPGNEQTLRALLRIARGAGQAAMSLPLAGTEARELYECSLAAYLARNDTIGEGSDRGLLRAICFNLGAHFQGRKQYADAIRHYQDAIVLDPDSVDTPNNLAQVLIENGQPLEALAMLKPAIQRNPDSAVLKHRKTQALEAAGRTAS